MGETAGISNLLIVLVVIIGALVAVGVTMGMKNSGDEINLSEDESLSDGEEEAASDAASDEHEEE
jgi:hypothetical protein